MSQTSPVWVRQRKALLIMAAIIAPLTSWRSVWVCATPTNWNHVADSVRQDLQAEFKDAAEFRVLFPGTTVQNLDELQRNVSRDIWEPRARVWLIAGDDLAPGWKGWDDNVNGMIDDAGELGASWSDDRCVTDPRAVPQPVRAETSRVMEVGAYRPATANSSERRPRLNVVYASPGSLFQ
ncbi:MAG: hypothetical protein AAGD07_23990 [Planctomycetota bacterium]